MKRLSSKLAYGLGGNHVFYCPGCMGLHPIAVERANPYNGAQWFWNNNADAPTFWPSIHVSNTCHSFIFNGVIEFLPDSNHSLKGKTVPLPDLPNWIE